MELVGVPTRLVPGRMVAPIRLTRRGRLVVLLFLLVMACLVIAFAAPASDAAGPAGRRTVVVVRPGDSLWSIAAHYLPSRDAPSMVDEIRRLNGLDGYTIYSGERLVLPSRR
jgi:LysM domain